MPNTLFSQSYLEAGLKETDEYQQVSPQQLSYFGQDLRVPYRAFVRAYQSSNEAQIEAALIRPVADVFADLEDPPAVNTRLHSLRDILVIALCTVVCGGRTGTDMELFGPAKREFPGSFPEPENGIPSHDTFFRVLGKPDPEAFGQWFVGFMAQFAEGVQG